jgi:hypothetical protein
LRDCPGLIVAAVLGHERRGSEGRLVDVPVQVDAVNLRCGGQERGDRNATLSPALNASAVVLFAARSIVNESPLRTVKSTISIVVPPALVSTSAILPLPDGLGNLLPSPACTVRVVSVADKSAASVEETGENANSRMPRQGARNAPIASVRAVPS